ncbi:DUF4091 domain-containing protein [Anaeromyxobacter paludicola]|uniref:Glycoside hydrolase 123 catalytic domain-containing protein n=1 Tax=Anaeromyxobacter paludicola TaxID=2918171 RepID=A0ABN6N229_9BACT|nr:glycoside hydrolase domain-containing protein [Anaeromyxobacter paludicola]BDG07116.1 hypothetical protein AMPC_02290 [Anaeromyxobacter paludicola]
MIRSRPPLAALALALPLALASAGDAAREPRPQRPEPPPAPVAAAPVALGVATSLDKLRLADPVPPEQAIALAAARGECESAQVAVRAPAGLAALTARAAPLAGPGGAIPVQLYRVATLSFRRGSGPDGAAGEWPDPLVPVEDAYFHEPRRAFPVAVPPGRLQAIWVEVCVPPGAAAGAYRGEVRLGDGARFLGRVPVALEVWPFALPATPTFPATFGLSTRTGTAALGRPGDPALARALAAAALRHRLTPHGLSADPPGGRCDERACALDWRAYDAEVGPILDGTLVPGVRGGFAEVRIPAAVWQGPESALLATLRAWRQHFEARGWAGRLFLYTLDEPSPAQLPELARRARAARAAGVPVFATTTPRRELEGLVDVWAPNLPAFLDLRARGLRGAPRPGRPEGALPWWYASCTSHGCGELPEGGRDREAMLRAYSGWPGYEIDRPGAAARAMGWLAFRAGVAGELYYDMLQSWGRDPWTDARDFAGNGDGTLLYPGRPERLGGTHPFPVESIRLTQIRDGLEDLELLRLAAAAGQRELAERLASALAPDPRRWERDPARYLAARRQLAAAVARGLARR